jgi:hypothetical protein
MADGPLSASRVDRRCKQQACARNNDNGLQRALAKERVATIVLCFAPACHHVRNRPTSDSKRLLFTPRGCLKWHSTPSSVRSSRNPSHTFGLRKCRIDHLRT